MSPSRPLAVSAVIVICSISWGEEPLYFDLKTPEKRQMTVQILANKSQKQRNVAWQKAKAKGWPKMGHVGKAFYALVAITDKRPYYLITDNANASISTAADQVHVAPFNLSGSGLTVGVWDLHGLPGHQEFGGRMTIVEPPFISSHHTSHVIGTICAAGANPLAKGMAPSILVDNYDLFDDISEMASRSASVPGELNKINISNQSYGKVTGWRYGDFSGNTGPHWMGIWPEREDRHFGQYSSFTSEYDTICYAAPYYLPFKSAGNGRDDTAPVSGTTFYYFDSDFIAGDTGTWIAKTFDPSSDPYDDGWDNGGYDTIGPRGVAKNSLTVGAVNDAVNGASRSWSSATMSDFSAWGPTDDGRIKPDLVANGVDLFSCVSSGTDQYGTMSGTSMASPNAMGSAALLVQHYSQLFPGQAMRSSTLKGLILHTANDLGNPGPNYSFGWGLMNTKVAADHIKCHYDFPLANKMTEGLLNSANPTESYVFWWDGASSIRATLCWTDPPGTPVSGLDDRTPNLVNDLDVRVYGPGGTPTYWPYILDVENPSVDATTGDNVVDNIEQILISLPTISGMYTAVISHKGTLTNGEQAYSLILSGQENTPPTSTPTPTENYTPTTTYTPTATETSTSTETPTFTLTPTYTDTFTTTPSPTATPNHSTTGTYTPTSSPTPTPTDAFGDNDGDGVANIIEDNGPNGGDANEDGIPDRAQANVASLPNAGDGRYVLILSPDGTSLDGVEALGELPDNIPDGTVLPFLLMEFQVVGITPGSGVTIDLILPEGVNMDSFFNYGISPGNPIAHWYEFAFDSITGVELSGNTLTLHLVDGSRGDDDGTANGVVSVRGGPWVEVTSDIKNWRLY